MKRSQSVTDQSWTSGGCGRFWLVLPGCVLIALDAGLTLAGQPESYWAGDFSLAKEANPLARWFLGLHPLAFSFLVLVWLAGFVWIVNLGDHRLAHGVAVLIALGHALGSASWLVQGTLWSWMVVAAFLVIACEGSVWCWRRYAFSRCEQLGIMDGAHGG